MRRSPGPRLLRQLTPSWARDLAEHADLEAEAMGDARATGSQRVLLHDGRITRAMERVGGAKVLDIVRVNKVDG